MEFKNYPVPDAPPLLSIQWKDFREEYRTEINTQWQGHIFQIKLHSYICGGPLGQRVNIDFMFDGETYSVRIVDSYCHKGKNGEIPDLKSKTHKLVTKVTLSTLDVYETPLSLFEIKAQEQLSSSGNNIPNFQTKQPIPDDSNKYDFRAKTNESWIMIDDNFSASEWVVAVPLPKVILWVKKTLDLKYNPNVNLYKYEFYSSSIRPLPLEMSGFICTKVYDVCKKTGKGIHCSISFEISDKNSVKRLYNSVGQGPEGILALLRFMLKISKFTDWQAVDSNLESQDRDGENEEFTSKEIQPTMIDEQATSIDKGVLNEETDEWEHEYSEPPERKKESWVSVTKDLKTEELDIPYNDDRLLLWIHKSFDQYYGSGIWLYNYELFSPDFHPMILKEGDFTCIGISDFCKSMGCGDYYSIQFKISDKNNVVRSFRGFRQMENGVIEVIEFLRALKTFYDWNDYVTVKSLYKSVGVTEEQIDKQLGQEISGLGINREGE